jgi:hypothetical protein
VDDRAVLFHSSTEDDYAPRTVIPIGDSKRDRHELRSLNLPLASGSEVTLASSGRMETLQDGRATDDGSSDAAIAEEFVTPSGELSFGLIGAAREQVEVAIVTADPMNVVLLLPVQLGVEGSAEVLCHSNGGDVSCSYPSYNN